MVADEIHSIIMQGLENRSPNIKIGTILETKEIATITTDILKLAEQLRNKGFDKYADNIEEKFIAFKKAEIDVYNTSKETGKDLIENAHPDGDVEVSDATDDLGMVETIVSQQKKDLEIVNKKLKLAEYVKQCKIVLSQDNVVNLPTEDQKKDFFDLANNTLVLRVKLIAALSPFKNLQGPTKKIEEYIEPLKDPTLTNLGNLILKHNVQGNVKEALNDIQYTISYALDILPKLQSYFVGVGNTDVVKKVNVLLNLFKSLEHLFLVYWNKYIVSDKSAADYHAQFISSLDLRNAFTGAISASKRFIKLLNELMLDPASLPAKGNIDTISKYLQGLEKTYNKVLEQILIIEGNVHTFSGGANITIEKLKNMFAKSGTDIGMYIAENGDFSSLSKLSLSILNIFTEIKKDVLESMKNIPAISKEELSQKMRF